MVCFVLALVVDGWLRWVLLAGAVVLPAVAVLLANAADLRRADVSQPDDAPRAQLSSPDTVPGSVEP